MGEMSGAEVLADMLAGYDVSHVFLVPAVLRMTMRELDRRTSVVAVRTHGEKAAAYMADGYARASHRPGICGAQVVGALNLAAGLRDAWLAHSPVIALTGGRDPNTKFRRVYQEVDDVPSFEPVTKMNATVDSAGRIPDMVRQAFRVAVSGTPGPVHLQFRGNAGQIDEETADMDPLVDGRFAAVPPYRPGPSADDVRDALDLLERAERPLLVAGGGVHWSGAGAEVARLASLLGIPVATSLNGKDSISGTHPCSVGVVGTYSRGCANQVALRADLVCFVGSETGSMVTDFWRVPPFGTPAIQVDINPEALGRNYPLSAAVLGDARTTLLQMLDRADAASSSRRAGWLSEARSICSSWQEEAHPALASGAVPVRPERICRELTQLMPSDAVVVVDTGNAGMWMGGMYDLTSPGQSYIRSAGHLGWAFSAGLGAKCAQPDRPVVVFTGDAGLWYHIGEIETAVRNRIKTVTVVNNNHSGNQSKPGMDRLYGGSQSEFARGLWTFTDVNLARIAEDMGAFSLRVEAPADFAPAFEKALDADRPAVIDVATDIDALPPGPVH